MIFHKSWEMEGLSTQTRPGGQADTVCHSEVGN